MRPDWCVLRISLFEKTFSLAAAPASERILFDRALAFAGTNLRSADLSGGSKVTDALLRYESRVRSRSTPRSLFAAAALATPDGGRASLDDVEVELAPRRQRQPTPATDLAAETELTLAAECVFHADGLTLYRYDDQAQEFRAVRLEMPDALRQILQQIRCATVAEWDAHLASLGMTRSGEEALTTKLLRLGVLRRRGYPALWNGPATTATVPLHALRSMSDDPQERNAFATFRHPIAMPKALAAIQEVGELLVSHSCRVTSAVPEVLSEWLDGRWLPLAELERMAEGLLMEAARRSRSDLEDDATAFVDWIRAHALDQEIDLTKAPRVKPQSSCDLLLMSEWTASGQLLEPQIFGVSARTMLGRYQLPGLSERLAALEEAPPVLLAYHGARTLSDVAEVHAPGLRALEYCGYGSDPSRGLRIEQLEVTAMGRSLRFRLRDTQEIVKLIPGVPWNEEHAKLHPFVRILLEEARSESPLVSLYKRALQDFPVRPRITYRGHIIRRRRAAVPRGISETELVPWLARCGLHGPLSLEIADRRLPLDPALDSPIRRELFKQLKAGKDVRIAEPYEPAGVLVDGREHAAHALIPVRVAAPQAAAVRPYAPVPPPASSREQRGPFLTLCVQALAERMPSILRQIQGRDLGDRTFYVVLSEPMGSELRLRLPTENLPAQAAAMELANELLDRGLIRSWSVLPYLREWERYGGSADIRAIEDFFIADSQALLSACAALGVTDPRRTDLYALCILQTLVLAAFDDESSRAFNRERFDLFSGEFCFDSEDRRAIGLAWRERKDSVLPAAAGDGDPLLCAALRLRRQHLGAWLSGAGNPARLRKHIHSLVHMTGTRLLFRDNRFEEARASFFALRALELWHHQGGAAEARAFLGGSLP